MLSTNIIAPPSPNWYGCHLVATQPHAQLVAYAGHNSVVVADCNSHSVQRTMCAGISRTTSVAWVPGASTVLVCGHDDGSMRAWDASTGSCVRSHRKKGPEISALTVLSRQPPMAVSGDVKGGLTAWVWHDGSKPRPISVGGGSMLRSRIMALAAFPVTTYASADSCDPSTSPPQQHLVLAASEDGSVTMVDVDTGAVLHTFAAHRGMVTSLCVHQPQPGSGSETGACPPLLVTASGDDGMIRVWRYSLLAAQQPPTCVSAISAMGGGPQAKGGPAGGRAPKGWLAACLVPHPTGYSVGGGSCWVAAGTAAGEVCVYPVNLSNGKVSAVVRNNRLHSRPIFSIDALYISSATALQAAYARAVAPGLPSDSADTALGEPGQAAASNADVTQAAAAAGLQTSSAGKGAVQGGQQRRQGYVYQHGQLVLVTSSQDRTLLLSELLLVDDPHAAAAHSSVNAGDAGQVDAQGPPPPLPLSGDAAQPDSNWPGLTARGGVSAQAVRHGQAAAAGQAGYEAAAPSAGPGQRARPAPERTAQGPVAGSKGFGGPLLRLAAAGGDQHALLAATAPAAAAEEDGAPAPGPVEEQEGEEEGGEASVDAGTPPPVSAQDQGTGGQVVTQQQQQAVAAGLKLGLSAVELAQLWKGVVLRAKGIALLWRLTGLGGYAYALDVVSGAAAEQLMVAGARGAGEAAGGEEGAGAPTQGRTSDEEGGVEPATGNGQAAQPHTRVHWQLAVGCGDRTARWLGATWECKPVRRARSAAAAAGISAGLAAASSPDVHSVAAVAATHEDAEVAGGGSAEAVAGEEGVRHAWVPCGAPKLAMTTLWKQVADLVLCVACHPTSTRYVAFGCQDGQVGVFDTRTHAGFVYPIRHQGPVLQIRWLGAPAPPQPSHVQAPTSSAAQDAAAPPPPPPPSPSPPPPDSEADARAAAMDGLAPESGAQPGKGKGVQARPGRGGRQTAAHDSQAGAGLTGVWWLVSSGGEGRLLAWRAPSADDLLGKPGPVQPSVRGRADRDGSWGAQPLAKPAHAPEDLGSYLSTLLRPDGDAPAAPGQPQGLHATACAAFTTLPHAAGLLLVAALRGGATVGVFRWTAPGGSTAAASSGFKHPLAGAGCGWVLAATCAPGSPTSLIACGMPESSSALLAVACAHGVGGISISHAQLPPASALPAQPAAAPVTSTATITSEALGSTVSSLCWLPGCRALAVAASDGGVQLWRTTHAPPQQADTAVAGEAAPSVAPEFGTAPFGGTGPQLLTTLKGHTDQVLGMVAAAPAAMLFATTQDTSVTWLFTASRDQAVRSWALDVTQLKHTAAMQQRQKQQQELEAARAKAQAKVDAAAAAAAALAAKPEGESAAAAVKELASEEAGAAQGAAAEEVTPAEGQAQGAGGANNEGAGNTASDDAAAPHLPAGMVAAPANSLLAGMPGSRKKKGPTLGARPILTGPEPQVLEAGERALHDLTSALSTGLEQEASGAPQEQLSAEKQVVAHMWRGDVRRALQVAVSNSCLTADVVSCSACLGRPTWTAASRLYAAQQEVAGQPHVAAMHLIAIGDPAAAAEVYRRAGLLAEAAQVRL